MTDGARAGMVTAVMLTLNAEKRELGTRQARAVRARGYVPAEIYGHGFPNIHVAVPRKEFRSALTEAGENTVIAIRVGEDEYPALIYDYQTNPLSDEVESVDFYRVRMDEKVEATVPLTLVGESPAVKEKKGILIRSMEAIEIEALPADIPREFRFDVGVLREVGDSLYVKDAETKGAFTVLVEPSTVVATIAAFEEEEQAAPVALAPDEVMTEAEAKKKAAEAEAEAKGEVNEKK